MNYKLFFVNVFENFVFRMSLELLIYLVCLFVLLQQCARWTVGIG